MSNLSMQYVRSKAGTHRIKAEGAWGGARWDGVLNVGMHSWKQGVHDRKYGKGFYELQPHNPQWIVRADQEIENLKKLMNMCAIPFGGVEHIGSTSIPGMVAKPGIHIMVGILDQSGKDRLYQVLRNLGWKHQQNSKLFIHHPDTSMCLYVSPVLYDKSYWRGRIDFRDHFINHPEDITKYSNLKMRNYNTGIGFNEYVAAKQEFIYNIMKLYNYTDDELILGSVINRRFDDFSIAMPTDGGYHVQYR